MEELIRLPWNFLDNSLKTKEIINYVLLNKNIWQISMRHQGFTKIDKSCGNVLFYEKQWKKLLQFWKFGKKGQ